MSSENDHPLTQDIGPSLIRMTAPMSLAITIILLFGAVDTYFISLLGTIPLAAAGFVMPVVFVLMNLTMGLGIGLSSVLAKVLGSGNRQQAARLTTDNLLLALLILLGAGATGLASMEGLFTALGADVEVRYYIREYMTPLYAGIVLLVIPMMGNGAIRATGDMKTPSVIMIIAGVINGILDPLLIFGIGPFPELGMQGAAIATISSWACSSTVACWVLYRRKRLLLLRPSALSQIWHSWRPVLYIGIPAAITYLLIPVSAALMTALTSRFGAEAVAAFGVGSRIESLTFVVVMAMSAVVTTLVGQNFGANQHQRVHETIRLAFKYCFWQQVLTYLLLLLLARPLAAVFSDDVRVIEATLTFLYILPASYAFQGLITLMGAALNALHKPIDALIINIVRLFVLYLPAAYLGALLHGYEGMFVGAVIASLIATLAAWLRFRRLLPAVD